MSIIEVHDLSKHYKVPPALVHENCRGRVAPCLVCFRLPWLSDRTRA